ncbi:nitrilase/amidohydrolase superfamily protein [Syntrophotalea carbinolica DSM 2380]|uniref:Nitrilase/amidohydrolase superfamily protein n=1 Tax=Syntrophotalea carbinolica (strain DSM 2380 / NBRC 103641 / GraBd1) TaxID=338963 RepID=Q3A713_SYNC1|nr:carbon-nitrogen hydrolase family protein [Syntrophotalea carbinolica]ABA87838.1 nitrilase/amidohydrolase superfamily protein [Syntrophotalea carbinolica DSM 2380]
MKPSDQEILRIAFLHLAPVAGDVGGNRNLLIKGMEAAAKLGAQWVLTPELCICGYSFADAIGTGWIEPQPDPWMAQLCQKAAALHMTLFLGQPEREPQSGVLFNSVFAVSEGRVVGRHRKINALRKGAEAWSTPGTRATPFPVPPVGKVGLMICGDAFSPDIALGLKDQGARMLISSAAWAPGFHGPAGEWERCTRDTGLPLLVCNRSGADRNLDFRKAQSIVAKDGRRIWSFSAPSSTVIVMDWNLATANLASRTCQRVAL